MILFAHGWGYDASFWTPVRAALGNPPSSTLDFGYFGAVETAISDEATLLVGHSLGFLWLIRQRALAHVPVVGINAFPRFIEGADYQPAVALRVLDRMRRRIAADAPAVLAEFWQRAGTPGPRLHADATALGQGLDQLAVWDERENLKARTSSVRLIAGTEDAIVPSAMTRMAFQNDAIAWLHGGHALPATRPTEIAQLIRTWHA